MSISATTRVKKSYSISREAEQFVRRVREVRNIASDSEALDQILRESFHAQSRAGINAAYQTFYNSASDEAVAEENSWAEFAEHEFAEISK